MEPVVYLAAVLVRDAAFLAALDEVREGAEPLEIAKRYVRRAGRTQRVMVEVVRRSASWSWPAVPAQPVLELTLHHVMVDAPLDDDDPPHWPHADYRQAAQRLAWLGAFRCLECGHQFTGEGRETRRYCPTHRDYAIHSARSHREAINGLLNAVGDALAIG